MYSVSGSYRFWTKSWRSLIRLPNSPFELHRKTPQPLNHCPEIPAIHCDPVVTCFPTERSDWSIPRHGVGLISAAPSGRIYNQPWIWKHTAVSRESSGEKERARERVSPHSSSFLDKHICDIPTCLGATLVQSFTGPICRLNLRYGKTL